jgi:putative addiction module component (TIGR02574 family)
MSAKVDEIVAQIERLSAEDRQVLLQRLLLIVDPPDPEIEATWLAEIERRCDALDRGESRAIPWEEARQRLGL